MNDQSELHSKVYWLYGLSGAGKTTLATAIAEKLNRDYHATVILDGDLLRSGLCNDLGFTSENRFENVRRTAELAKLLCSQGFIVIVALMTPQEDMRDLARSIICDLNFVEVYVMCDYDTCSRRDSKGLYSRASNGELINFPGRDLKFDEPKKTCIAVDTANYSVQSCVEQLLGKILQDYFCESKEKKIASPLLSEWHSWIALNLMKGASAESLKQPMKKSGFSNYVICSAIEGALNSPYIEAGRRILRTLNKREWLMSTCDKLGSLDDRYCNQIEARDCPDFETFVNEYYSKNLPVILTRGVENWKALEKWDPQYLAEHYGNKEIEVQFGRDGDSLYERQSGLHKKLMRVNDYINLITNGVESNDYYMTAGNTKNSLSSIGSLFNDLGDFGDGYRRVNRDICSETFIWIGPKGTFTPIHYDLTNNMLVQIYGRKKITLIPAMQVPFLYNEKGVFSEVDFPDYDKTQHCLMEQVTPIDVIIGPGEALFIPIGWWHCVQALDVSISVSFTDFNVRNDFAENFPRD